MIGWESRERVRKSGVNCGGLTILSAFKTVSYWWDKQFLLEYFMKMCINFIFKIFESYKIGYDYEFINYHFLSKNSISNLPFYMFLQQFSPFSGGSVFEMGKNFVCKLGLLRRSREIVSSEDFQNRASIYIWRVGRWPIIARLCSLIVTHSPTEKYPWHKNFKTNHGSNQYFSCQTILPKNV